MFSQHAVAGAQFMPKSGRQARNTTAIHPGENVR